MPFDTSPLPPKTTTPLATDLAKAKQYLIDHGWCQHRLVDKDGRVCALGAIHYGLYTIGTFSSLDAQGHAIDVLQQAVGGCIPVWNNAPGRTLDEVLAAFDRAIELAEK